MYTSDDEFIPEEDHDYDSDCDSDSFQRKLKARKRMQKKRKHNEIQKANETDAQLLSMEMNDPLVKLSDEDMLRIYDEVSNAFKKMEQHVCAVCDNFIVALACTHTVLSSISQTLLNRMRKRLVFPNDLPDLLRLHYDVSSFSMYLLWITQVMMLLWGLQ